MIEILPAPSLFLLKTEYQNSFGIHKYQTSTSNQYIVFTLKDVISFSFVSKEICFVIFIFGIIVSDLFFIFYITFLLLFPFFLQLVYVIITNVTLSLSFPLVLKNLFKLGHHILLCQAFKQFVVFLGFFFFYNFFWCRFFYFHFKVGFGYILLHLFFCNCVYWV